MKVEHSAAFMFFLAVIESRIGVVNPSPMGRRDSSRSDFFDNFETYSSLAAYFKNSGK